MGYSWVSHSTLIYTSGLTLCSTICVHSATRHNIHMYLKRTFPYTIPCSKRCFLDLALFGIIFTKLKRIFKAVFHSVSSASYSLYLDLLQLLFAHTSSAISPIEPIVCLNYSHLCFAPLRNTCGNNSTAHEVHRTLRCSLFPGMKYESRSESLFDRYGLYEVGKHCWQNLFCHRETSVQENPGTCTVR